MTGYTVHTGTNKKFTEGWDRVFMNEAKTAKKTKKKPVVTARKKRKKKK